ncbi:hypothetical protein JCM8547_005831 [Rhodosporidiobolus lusitaniae]
MSNGTSQASGTPTDGASVAPVTAAGGSADSTAVPSTSTATINPACARCHSSKMKCLHQHPTASLRNNHDRSHKDFTPTPPLPPYLSPRLLVFRLPNPAQPLPSTLPSFQPLLPQDIETPMHEYWSNLNSITLVLDPELDTFESSRVRSPLLFTAICATAAQHLSGLASLSSRLERHFRTLLSEALLQEPASLEFTQSLLHAPVDELSDLQPRYFAMAANAYREVVGHERRTGFVANSRLARSRERSMFVLYLFDSGYSIFSGNPATIAVDARQYDLVQWCNSPDALPLDQALAACVDIRRRLSSSPIIVGSAQSLGPSTLRAMAEDLLADWEATWLSRPALANDAWISLVRRHSELTLLNAAASNFLSGPPASSALAASILGAALRTCKEAVSLGPSGSRLSNHTVVMITHAALVVLKFMSVWPADTDVMAVLRAISSTLASWGSVPHRKARSAVYATYLDRAIDSAFLADLPLPSTPAQQPAAQNVLPPVPQAAVELEQLSNFSDAGAGASGESNALDQLLMMLPLDDNTFDLWTRGMDDPVGNLFFT